MLFVVVVFFAAALALAFAAFNFAAVKKMPEGTERMSEIAAAIRVGANAFINYEYRILAIVVACIAVLMAIITTWHAAAALLIGAVMSASAGFIGMKIATYANVRVSNRARESRSIGDTVKVAFRGGSVMGLCVGGCALLGLFLVYLIFGLGLGQREGAVGFDRVLGGHDHKGLGQRHGRAVDRDLLFLHGLKKARLCARGGAVYLVGQDDVGEEGAGTELEGAGVLVIEVYAGQVGGQKIGGELDALEACADRLGKGAEEHGLACPGDILEKDVARADEAGQDQLYDVVLADDGL